MEEKRLDFNAPLLSLRRHHVPVASSSVLGASARKGKSRSAEKAVWPLMYQNELQSEVVTRPVTIPFDWEHKPGKAKDFPVGNSLPERSVSMPRLPPGRMVSDVKKDVNNTIVETKGENLKSVFDAKKQTVKSVLLDGREFRPEKKSPECHGGGTPLLPNSHAMVNGWSPLKEEGENPGEGDIDAFSDALETFSLAEVSAFDGSVNNVSAVDGKDSNRIENSIDPKDRSFMMDRFLPAAKPMASEMPHHVPRRQSLPNDPIKQRSWDQRDTEVFVRQPNPYTTLRYALKQDVEEEEDDDDGDDLAENSMAGVCGFLPWSMKNSLCLINPFFQGACFKNKSQMPLPSSSTRNIRRSKSNFSATFSKSGEMTLDDVYRHKLVHNIPCPSLHDNQSTSPSVHVDTSNNRGTCWSDFQTLDLSSSCMNSVDGVVSYRREAFHSFRETTGLWRDTSRSKTKMPSCSISSADANTLRYESTCAAETSNTKSSPEEIKEIIQPIDKGSAVLVDDDQAKPFGDSLECNKGRLDTTDKPQSPDIVAAEPFKADAGLCTSREGLHFLKPSNRNVLMQERDNVNKEHPNTSPIELQMLGGVVGVEDGVSEWQINGNPLEVVNKTKSSLSVAAAAPPLPKSPSESWLFRAIPAVARRSPSSLPILPSKKSSTKSLARPRWETIIKSINLDHGQLWYSEELGKTTPHQRGN